MNLKNQLILFIAFFFNFSIGYAQTVIFSENFDGATHSMTASGTPGFNISTTYFNSGSQSIAGQYAVNGESTLTTPSFNTTSNNFVLLSFQHICKTTFFDSCVVEVSIDNGATWTILTDNNSIYLGSSALFPNFGKFSALDFPLWDFGNPAVVNNTWWKQEEFDISALCSNAANVQVRFRAKDANNNGGENFAGWYIDDVEVVISTCELFDPSLLLTGNYPHGVSYLPGPFTVDVSFSDGNSGIDTASVVLNYYIQHNGQGSTTGIPMVFVSGTLQSAQLTAQLPAAIVGDTIVYYITGIDLCGNDDITPLEYIYMVDGTSIPFIDNFDGGNAGWSNLTISGSSWEMGTPNYGVTTGALTAPNAWDVNLNGAYAPSTECHLYSPVFDFTGITGATLSFWQNYFNEVNYDGTRLETSIDNGVTWQLLGTVNDPLATNWYTDASINSSLLPAWEGNSGGWEKSTYRLNAFDNQTQVRFRFIFTSETSQEKDGHSIDNFTILPAPDFDIGVSNVVVPSQQMAGSTANVTCFITNYGLQNASGYSVVIAVNGVPVDTANPSFNIPQNGIYVQGFNITVPPDSFDVCIYTILTGDTTSANNTSCSSAFGVPVLSLPYFDNFDGVESGWIASTGAITTSKWQKGMPSYNSATGAFSGNACWDINLTSAYFNNALAYLTTPYFDLNIAAPLRIGFRHRYKTNTGHDGTRIEYQTQNLIWMPLGVLNDTTGFDWYNSTLVNAGVNPGWSGSTVGWDHSYLDFPLGLPATQVRFRFIFTSDNTTSPNSDGYSLDDFYIISMPSADAGVVNIGSISGGSGNTISPAITIQNFGSGSITNFPVLYMINGVQMGSANYTDTLYPGQSAVFPMPGFTIPQGSFNFCASTVLAGDGVPFNDTLCINGVGAFTALVPYYDDFESATNWTTQTTGDPGTNWELGMPAFGATNSTHSGVKCWDINLNTAYTNNAMCYLTSPYFDISTPHNDTLSFWHNYAAEDGWDGVRLEYDLNASGNWTILGSVSDPASVNWYSDATLNSTQLPGWEGVSGGWVQSKYALASLGSQSLIQFRFIFASDGAFVTNGYSIDDFIIYSNFQMDAGVQSIVSPASNTTSGTPVNLEVKLRNYGYTPTNSINIYYSFNNSAFSTASWPTAIDPDSSVTISLGQVIPLAGSNSIRVYISMAGDLWQGNDTLDYTFNAVLTASLPYTQDFETANTGWVAEPSTTGNTTWELGMPNFGATNSVHAGSSCWDVNLLTAYGNGVNTRLISPVFNYSNMITSQMRCWVNYNTEFGADGVRLLYTIDGINFQPLGTYNDVNGTNWYNIPGVTAFNNEPAWTGGTVVWQEVTYNTSAFYGQSYVQYIFEFKSDPTLSSDGFSIDDFVLDGTIAVNEMDADYGIHVYPNPVNDDLYIVFDKTLIKPVSITLRSITGGEILKYTITAEQNQIKINLREIPTGIYIVESRVNDVVYFSRIIKQ